MEAEEDGDEERAPAAAAEKGARPQDAAPSEAKAEAPAPVVLHPGQVIQDFEIIKPLGKGKFSIVYMAKRLTDGLLCALKKINIFDMMVPKQREKCLKEVRLLESLNHPNIVKLLCSFVDSNELLIIVEWAEKGDLKRLIRKALQNETRFSEPECWQYCRQLCGALDHMHKKRIMHRDLKPANIFVSLDGSLKLGDLGLGRFFSSHTLEAFSKVGTPLYMSPEVLRGAGYDMRSDVWSLGCVLYELVMLRSPFKSDQQVSLYDLFVRISKGQFPPMPETFSKEFRGLVCGMLEIDPMKRPDSGQALQVSAARCKELEPKRRSGELDSDAAPERLRGQSRPSPLLVMDDIVEKLKLLECEELFLRPRGFPMLHRCFFTMRVPMQRFTQFQVMFELVMWLLAMLRSREDPGGEGLATLHIWNSQDGFAEVDAARLATELAARLEGRGIQASSDTTLNQLSRGYGESVCLILNELINQELTSRNFHFQQPSWGAFDADASDAEVSEEEELAASESRSCDSGDVEEEDPARRDRSSREAGALEPIHHAVVDVQAWHAEVGRVKDRLRLSAACRPENSTSWCGTLARAAGLCRSCAELSASPLLHEGLPRFRGDLRLQLAGLRGHEDRLNATLRTMAEDAARLRVESEAETERLGALRESVAGLSQTLAALADQLEAAEADAAGCSEALHNTDQLGTIRKSVQRLREDNKTLEVRLRYIQGRLLPPSRAPKLGGRDGGGSEELAWGPPKVGEEP